MSDEKGPVGMSDKPHPAGPGYGTLTSQLSSPRASKAFTRPSSVSDAASTFSGGPIAPVSSDRMVFVSDMSHTGRTSIEISALSLDPFVKNALWPRSVLMSREPSFVSVNSYCREVPAFPYTILHYTVPQTICPTRSILSLQRNLTRRV